MVLCFAFNGEETHKVHLITFSISVLVSLMCEIMRLDLSMLPWETQEKKKNS